MWVRLLFFLVFSNFILFADEKEIANQTHQDLFSMPSISKREAGVHKVPLIIATEETLDGFGHIVQNYEDEEVIIVTWPAASWRPVIPDTGRGTISPPRILSLSTVMDHSASKLNPTCGTSPCFPWETAPPL